MGPERSESPRPEPAREPVPKPINDPVEVPGFSRETLPRDEPNRHPWIWLVYALAYSLSIPWYLPRGVAPPIWFGFPYWVILSLIATVFVAGFTAFVYHTYWRDWEDDDPPEVRE